MNAPAGVDLPLMHDGQMVRESECEVHVVEDRAGDHLPAGVLILHYLEDAELQSGEKSWNLWKNAVGSSGICRHHQ